MVLKQEDFTEQAREALGVSQQLVLQMRHSQWDAEHLLVGLLQVENSVPVQLLQHLGVDADELAGEITGALERTPKISGDQSATGQIFPRLSRSMSEART